VITTCWYWSVQTVHSKYEHDDINGGWSVQTVHLTHWSKEQSINLGEYSSTALTELKSQMRDSNHVESGI
jgi:hypothetical protein